MQGSFSGENLIEHAVGMASAGADIGRGIRDKKLEKQRNMLISSLLKARRIRASGGRSMGSPAKYDISATATQLEGLQQRVVAAKTWDEMRYLLNQVQIALGYKR
jgi:hypothetical protein